MGPNSVQASNVGSVGYGTDEMVIEGNVPAVQTLSAEQIAELQLALSSIDGGSNPVHTRGVVAPRQGEQKVDTSGMEAALDDADANVSTDIYAFMALFNKLAQEMRNAAKEQRQGELQAQVSSINSAADKMVEAAEKRFAAAVVQSTIQIVGGAISIGSGFASIKSMASASKADMKTGSAFLNKQTAQQGILNGSSQVISGLGGIVSGGIEMSASFDDAAAKRLDAEGTAAQARREASQEVAQNMADLIKDIREQLRAINQSNIETSRGIARNI